MQKIYIYVRGGVVISVTDKDGQELHSDEYEVVDYDNLGGRFLTQKNRAFRAEVILSVPEIVPLSSQESPLALGILSKEEHPLEEYF